MADYLLLYTHPERAHICWAICQPTNLGLPDEEAIRHVAAGIDRVTGTVGTFYRLADPAEVSGIDPRYRECLEDNGAAVVINREKARAVDAALR